MPIAFAIVLFIISAVCLVYSFACACEYRIPLALLFLVGATLAVTAGVLEIVAFDAFAKYIGILLCVFGAILVGIVVVDEVQEPGDTGHKRLLTILAAIPITTGIHQLTMMT